jgi:KaiC/GvpD/RAD55 family RecA-like ATPase
MDSSPRIDMARLGSEAPRAAIRGQDDGKGRHPERPTDRRAFGLEVLDAHLGGGLRPGTITVIAGATGAGKTQLGLAWAERGTVDDPAPGVVIDLTSRGDSQNHEAYHTAHHGRALGEFDLGNRLDPSSLWDRSLFPGRLLRPFALVGRRVTRPDLDAEAWHAWKCDLARVLRGSAAFLYTHFVRGARRIVIDGLEPTDTAAESVQFDFVEYLHHHVLKQEDEWTAREVLREAYRAHEAQVLAHPYDHAGLATLVLATTPEVMLHDLVAAPVGRGGLFATASTVILMGRTSDAGRLGRALCVVKHRGSACRDEFLPYTITADGLQFPES